MPPKVSLSMLQRELISSVVTRYGPEPRPLPARPDSGHDT
jgi:hypothetical protein